MFTGLFHYFTPEVKLSPTRKSSSFVYERLKPDRTNPITDIQTSTDFTRNADSELTDKPSSSYHTRSLHNGDTDRQIVEQDECRDREIAPEEEYHDARKKIIWKDWLKEPQFYQVRILIWEEDSVLLSWLRKTEIDWCTKNCTLALKKYRHYAYKPKRGTQPVEIFDKKKHFLCASYLP